MEVGLRFRYFSRLQPSFFATKHGTVTPDLASGGRTRFQKISITAQDGPP